MTKFSQLPIDAAPTMTDYMPTLDQETTTTKRFTLTALAALLFTQTNIPSGGGNPVTRDNESMFAYVANNTGVWSGDAYASTRLASMTALVCYINGRRIPISAVTSRTFTASKDTYIDVLDNADGTGTLVYTEVTNNAASPALASNSLRIGIIITGASSIAAATSVNQGQETMLLPIVSSAPYAVTDSLGNLICSRDPNRCTIGYRQITAQFDAGTSAVTDVFGLSCPAIVPAGRKVEIVTKGNMKQTGAARGMYLLLREGSTTLDTGYTWAGGGAGIGIRNDANATVTPSAGLHTYKASIQCDVGANVSLSADPTFPAYIKVKLS
jgi:hypothetical protein